MLNLKAAPASCRPFLFRIPPPPKNQNGNERQGQRAATRGTPRVGRGSLGIGAYLVGTQYSARGAREVRGFAPRNGFAQRLELHHKLKLPRWGGKIRRAPQARGGVRVRISPFEFGQNPTAGMDARNEIMIV